MRHDGDVTVFHALAGPERRRLCGDGAEDGCGAEEDEGAVHGALPCLCGGHGIGEIRGVQVGKNASGSRVNRG